MDCVADQASEAPAVRRRLVGSRGKEDGCDRAPSITVVITTVMLGEVGSSGGRDIPGVGPFSRHGGRLE
jgi:hypothetical protein